MKFRILEYRETHYNDEPVIHVFFEMYNESNHMKTVVDSIVLASETKDMTPSQVCDVAFEAALSKIRKKKEMLEDEKQRIIGSEYIPKINI